MYNSSSGSNKLEINLFEETQKFAFIFNAGRNEPNQRFLKIKFVCDSRSP